MLKTQVASSNGRGETKLNLTNFYLKPHSVSSSGFGNKTRRLRDEQTLRALHKSDKIIESPCSGTLLIYTRKKDISPLPFQRNLITS